MRRLSDTPSPAAAFTLLELLLALSLGLLLCGVIVQGLLAEGRNSQRFGRHLRERQSQWRSLELVRHDVRQSTTAEAGQGDGTATCGLAGRTAVLQLQAAQGRITYSVGAAPSAIWRGRVLMRCGPAFGLHGELSSGDAQSRVVIDGLPRDGAGFTARLDGRGGLELSLRQAFDLVDGRTQGLESKLTVAVP